MAGVAMTGALRAALVAAAVVATAALVLWSASGGGLDDAPAPVTTLLPEAASETDAARDLLLELLPMPPAGLDSAFAAPELPAAARHLGGGGDRWGGALGGDPLDGHSRDGVCPIVADVI